MEVKEKLNKKKSTIVMGIFLLIVLLITIFQLIPFNLEQEIANYFETMQNSNVDQEQVGELIIILSLVSGIGLLALYIYAFTLVILTLVPSVIVLVVSKDNLLVTEGIIKKINFGYVVISALVVVICIVKNILFNTKSQIDCKNPSLVVHRLQADCP